MCLPACPPARENELSVNADDGLSTPDVGRCARNAELEGPHGGQESSPMWTAVSIYRFAEGFLPQSEETRRRGQSAGTRTETCFRAVRY
ncbi:hypothetical protein SKAU_G00065600 [Synaphobranchus kaupii]|uniref:Uncharacterized protein n=1 Tax=Synaphobranchus kaupii TaxID=118154 RepID=A0A9Q1G7A2_SYNKA|nr:hypothetical protein SKAU_G00065600 [Synaphobranchus kaupii]